MKKKIYHDISSPHKEFGIKSPYHAGRARYKEPAEVIGVSYIVRKAKRNKSGKKVQIFFGKKDKPFV